MFETTKDDILLIECKTEVQKEKRCTARVLEYLAEIDKRRLWVQGYSSLFDFCMRYLNYSEGETNRRIQACRLSVKVEEVKSLLEEGTLSLTTMSLLSPFLTKDNAKEILPKVVGQSKTEVERVLTQHFPERAVQSEVLVIKLDAELKALLEEAKIDLSENKPEVVLKRILRERTKKKNRRCLFQDR